MQTSIKNPLPFNVIAHVNDSVTNNISEWLDLNLNDSHLRTKIFYDTWDKISYWYSFPWFFNTPKYAEILTTNTQLTKVNEVYQLSKPIFDTIERVLPDLTIVKAEFNSIPPNIKMAEHVDQDWAWWLASTCRVHAVIKTNPNVYMYNNGEVQHFPQGSIFEFNNSYPHKVTNEGTDWRTHMVIDCIKTVDLEEFDQLIQRDIINLDPEIYPITFNHIKYFGGDD